MPTDIRAKIGTVEYTRVEMTQVVLPQFANSLGTVFGGQIMAWVDVCAAVSAQRHSRSPVVTASFDSVHFISPVKQGHIVIIKSQVNSVFKSSMEIGSIIIAENPLTGERKRAARAYCTFVALDAQSHLKEIPELILLTEEDHRRHEQATERRRVRLQTRRVAEEHTSIYE